MKCIDIAGKVNKTINIALLGSSFIKWGGGIDFLLKCSNVLLWKSETYPIKIFLLLPNNNLIEILKNIIRPYRNMVRDILKLKKPYYYKNSIDNTLMDSFSNINAKIQVIFYNNTRHGLISCLQKIGADVVLPAINSLGCSFPIPWAGYIYDFQHKYFPQFFSPETCVNRDRNFGHVLSDAQAMIVNSMAVKNDINKFFPDTSCRVFNLPFAPVPSESWFDAPECDLKAKYRLPERYFVISNQFWIHKSHITAFEALSKLNNFHYLKDLEIICTGKTEDNRFPGYFDGLKKRIANLGVSEKIRFLGHIPKKDQIYIMCNSIAVLQPTLFEGGPGGGSVHDAVAIGVPAIVSDIPVNVEIKEENVFFFKAGSVDDMAEKIIEVLNREIVRPEKNILLEKGRARTEMFGGKLLEAILFLLN